MRAVLVYGLRVGTSSGKRTLAVPPLDWAPAALSSSPANKKMASATTIPAPRLLCAPRDIDGVDMTE